MLCPLTFQTVAHPADRPHARVGLALAAALLCLGPALANPAAPSVNQEKMLEAARQWVAQTQQVPAAQVRFAALDSRIKVDDCDTVLQLDYPFNPSRDTLRVRCPQAKPWQLFLRLMPVARQDVAAPPISPAAAAAAAAPSAAAMATRTVVITRKLVQRGTLLDASVLELVERPAQGLDPLVVGSLKDVEMAESMRDIPAGTVLRSYDIKRALMVRKGQTAVLTTGQGSGFQVRVGLEAQQDGHIGEQIRLKNPESGRLLSGIVTGPNAVRAVQD